MAKRPKQYSDKLRRKVVRKVMDERQSIVDVARVHGVPVGLIDHWVDEEIGKRGDSDYLGYSTEELLAERDRLLREREYLLARRDIASDVGSGMKGSGLDIAGLNPSDYEDEW